MTTEELRSIPLFEGLADDQVRELSEAGHEVAFQPGDVLFRAGQPADVWWLLLDGKVELVRHAGHEDTVVGTMDTPGQWAGGFRAWDPHGGYMATGRAVTDGRFLRVPAERLGVLAQAWFPFGVHLIQGLMQTVRNIESTARQREALVALGTLAAGLAHEINNPASAATRAVDALHDTCDALMSSLRRLAESGLSAAQFVELDALRQALRPSALGDDPLALADREEELSDWLVEHGVGEDWLLAPALAPAGVEVAWCDRVAALVPAGLPRPRAALGGELALDRGAAGGGQGVDPAGVVPGGGGPVLLPARPRVGPAHGHHRGAREHPDGAGAQAGRGDRGP